MANHLKERRLHIVDWEMDLKNTVEYKNGMVQMRQMGEDKGVLRAAVE